MPFEVTIPEQERDANLQEKLRSEFPGILNWALAGCLDWLEYGLVRPDIVKAATASYRTEMDSVSEFLDEEIVKEPDAFVTVKALYEAYRSWCMDSGEAVLAKNPFGMRLKGLGYSGGKSSKHGRFWRDIRLIRSNDGISMGV